MNSHQKNDSGNFVVFIAFASLLLLFTLAITLAIGVYADETSRGTFGDMFGFANAVFTGLSFIGLLMTISLQRKDLNEQREELQKQSKTLHIQNFENTFFQMLNLFNSIMESTEITSGGTLYKSRKAFLIISNEVETVLNNYTKKPFVLARILKAKRIDIKKKTSLDYLEIHDLSCVYDEIYKKYQDVLGHYFRTYYHVIKLIDKTDGIDKSQYISIARSQISNSEQILLFYNCLHKNGEEKFKPFVENYALLHNLNIEELPSIYYKDFFKDSAYNYTKTYL